MTALHQISQPFHRLQCPLLLDDAEEEVWRAATTQQLPKFEGAIHGLDEFNDRWWYLSSRPPKKQNRGYPWQFRITTAIVRFYTRLGSTACSSKSAHYVQLPYQNACILCNQPVPNPGLDAMSLDPSGSG